jgi:hypothetical protein
MQDKVKKIANELYEFYERDYTSFINSKLRAISYCNRKIWASDSNDNKLIWVEVKKELKDNY